MARSNNENTLDELKLFIFEENRDFSSVENMILTVLDAKIFIHNLTLKEINTHEMSDQYEKFIHILVHFKESELITLCTFQENDLCER